MRIEKRRGFFAVVDRDGNVVRTADSYAEAEEELEQMEEEMGDDRQSGIA